MEFIHDPTLELKEAKADFRKDLLSDDVSTEVLMAFLDLSPQQMTTDLPEFAIEPTLQRQPNGPSLIGLRIARSKQSTNQAVSFGLAEYSYIPIGEMNVTDGTAQVSSELTDLLALIGREKKDALSMFLQWQAGVKKIGDRIGDNAAFDPISNVIGLQSEFDRRVYLPHSES